MDREDPDPKYNPVDKIPLHKDVGKAPCCKEWRYRSSVGMMLYLTGSSRPYIAYAVHKCARFSNDPKYSHEVGIKQFSQYLKHTRAKGLVMIQNTKDLKLDLFADADFAGFL